MLDEYRSPLRDADPWPGNDAGMHGYAVRGMLLADAAAVLEAATRIAAAVPGASAYIADASATGEIDGDCLLALRSMSGDAAAITEILARGGWGLPGSGGREPLPSMAAVLGSMAKDAGRDAGVSSSLATAAGLMDAALHMASSTARVYALMSSMGVGIVAHLSDDDDNAGEWMRRSADGWPLGNGGDA